MELTKQVVSLDLAKRMKELGAPQESLFWWVEGSDWFVAMQTGEYQNSVSAYTVAELGDMLPREVNVPLKGGRKRKDPHHITYAIWTKGYQGNYKCGLNHRSAIFYHNEYAYTEADARAKMWCYLKENNLI